MAAPFSHKSNASTQIGDGANARREAIRAAALHPSRVHRSTANPAQSTASTIMLDHAPSVFVSYSHADQVLVHGLVDWLRKAGAVVTWDQDFVGGADTEKSIRKAIKAAHAVIVVWSKASVVSSYVGDEARLAHKTSRLITTHVTGLDIIDIPLGFGHLNSIPVDDHDRIVRSLAEDAHQPTS